MAEHWKEIGRSINEQWHVISGVTLAILWGAVRVKRAIFRDYVTVKEMRECEDRICSRIDTVGEKLHRRLDEHLNSDALMRRRDWDGEF